MHRFLVAFSLATLSMLTAAEPRKIFDYPYQQHDFPNGLRLVTVPTDYPNIVALYVVVNVGSRNEVEAGKSGFAHFFEHVMFRGTKKNPPQKRQSNSRPRPKLSQPPRGRAFNRVADHG